MRVFVAGATGALGVPVVRALVARGHEVTGSFRSEHKRPILANLGARAVIADAMDADRLGAAVAEARPEVVVDALTALPKAGPMRPSDMAPTNEIRIHGSGHLMEAAIAVGARRIVAESFFLVYGSGDLGAKPLSEEVAVPVRPSSPYLRDVIDAMVRKEGRVLEASRQGRIEGIVLRFGGFYGVGTGIERMVQQLRQRKLPVVGSPPHVTPWIHIEDAAAAVVAAVERGRPGRAYNVVDDQPMSLADILRCLAAAVGAPAPMRVPAFVLQLAAPYLKAVFVDGNVHLSNERAKADLHWLPRFRSVEEGLPAVLSALSGPTVA